MKKVHLAGITVMVILSLAVLPMLTACGGDNETEEPSASPTAVVSPSVTPGASQTPTPTPVESPSPTPQPTASESPTEQPAEPEIWTFNVTGEEAVEGIDTYTAEASFSTVPMRVTVDGRNLRFESYKEWRSTETFAPVRTDVTTSIELTPGSWLEDLLSITTVTYTGEPGIPLSVGKTWSSENLQTLEPKIANDKVMAQAYEVTALEEITVPMGTYNCYRVEITRPADDAQVRTEWWAEGDEFRAPLKAIEYNYAEPEVKEMVSYNPDQWVYQVTVGL